MLWLLYAGQVHTPPHLSCYSLHVASTKAAITQHQLEVYLGLCSLNFFRISIQNKLWSKCGGTSGYAQFGTLYYTIKCWKASHLGFPSSFLLTCILTGFHMVDIKGVSLSSLWYSQLPAVANIWGVNQWLESHFFYHSAFQVTIIK